MKNRIYAMALCLAMMLPHLTVAALAAEDAADAAPAEEVVIYDEPASEPAPPAEETAPEAPAEEAANAPAPELTEEETEPSEEAEIPADAAPAEEAEMLLPDTAQVPATEAAPERVIRIRAPDDDSAAAARYEMTREYIDTKYYDALRQVGLTGDQRKDIVSIALSQVGYRERGRNRTEYALYTGTQGFEWCASFISWCAGQAGIDKSVVPVASGAYLGSFGAPRRYSGKNIRPGDIICFNYGEHVGIVYDVDDVCVYTVEGNLQNKVTLAKYAHSNSRLTYYYAPDYRNAWYTDDDGALRYRDVNTGEEPTGWLALGTNRYYIADDGIAATGITEIDGRTYRFDETTGLLCTGWLETDEGWQLFAEDNDGAMCTGWYVSEDGAYYFDDDGYMLSGHEEVDGETRFYAAGYEGTVPAELFYDADSLGTL